MSAAATHQANRSYREVLGNRHVAGLLLETSSPTSAQACSSSPCPRRPLASRDPANRHRHRMAGSSSRRLLATSMADQTGRFAVNGLLGRTTTFARYLPGPVLGGVIVATTVPASRCCWMGAAR
jgi:hypothetical protein